MFKKVLILSASVGAGHLRAAEAIEKSFHLQNFEAEIVDVNVLQYTNPLFRRLYGKAYLEMVNMMPKFWTECTIRSNENKRRKFCVFQRRKRNG